MPCSDGLVTWHCVKTFTTQACGDAGTDVQAQRVQYFKKTRISLFQFLHMLGIWEHTVRKLQTLYTSEPSELSAAQSEW